MVPKIGKDHLVPDAIVRARLFAAVKNSHDENPPNIPGMGTLSGLGTPLSPAPIFQHGNSVGHTRGTGPASLLKSAANGRQQYQPYTTEQVERIVREARKLRLELFLCIVVQAYSGCRISEIAGRRVGDIRLEDGIWCLAIATGKTKSSVRIIPLHPSVAACSFRTARE